ncbi:MAG: hypothetical protein E6R04_00055 [Spirochaetes bacterium]|nr:MAG: hypothetical protein E6R04_00055 [Spirochaetota bacterium]
MPAYPLPGATTDLNSHVYWDLQKSDGTWFPLHTYAWSVKSFGGKRFFTGTKRGEDVALPYRNGRIYTPKIREAQNYDINMWVFPTNQNGTRDPDKTIEQKTHENIRKIIAAVDQEGQFRLRKRWYDESSTSNGFSAGQNIKSAIAMAEFIDGSGPSSDDGKDYYLDLTFSLADPFFYGRHIHSGYPISSFVSSAVTLNNNSTTQILKEGDVPSSNVYIEITLSGSYSLPAENPVIQFPNGNWIELQAHALSSKSGTIVIDCANGIAARSTLTNYLSPTGEISTYVNGLIRRNPRFMSWPQIDTSLSGSHVTISSTGSGTIKLAYNPAYR